MISEPSTSDMCCLEGKKLGDETLLMGCQRTVEKLSTGFMAGDSNGMNTNMCFENFETVTTLTLIVGTLVSSEFVSPF